MKIGLAFRAFFGALFDSSKASAIDAALNGIGKNIDVSPVDQAAPATRKVQTDAPKQPAMVSSRSDAVTLLSVLQREARLIDLVQEPLDSYSDAQVGAAARDVLKQSQKVLKRLFDIQPLASDDEGSQITKPTDLSASRFKVIGDITSKSKVTIVHPGWVAKTQQVPVWTGNAEDQLIITPTEIE